MMTFFHLFFTKMKTLKGALNKAKENETIPLHSKKYKESICFEKDVTLIGERLGKTIIEGIFIVPKDIRVTFQHVTIAPTAQFYIEGEAIFEHCTIRSATDVLLTVNGGYIKGFKSTFTGAKEVAIALLNNSSGIFEHCTFHHNGKHHLLLKNSKAFIEGSQFSNATQGIWMTNQSFAQSKNCYFAHHDGIQIKIEESTYIDHQSTIERGKGHGLVADNESTVTLNATILYSHAKSQIFIQNNSVLHAKYCTVLHGNEYGIMFQQAEGSLFHCEISQHQQTNVYVLKKSRLHIEQCEIHSGNQHGLLISKESIVNCNEITLKSHPLAQVFITEKSICSMKECIISNGQSIGFMVEKKSDCMLAYCKVVQNDNSAINVHDSKLKVFSCKISENNGNGILATTHAKVEVDGCKFFQNQMPHIASKTKVKIHVANSDFYNGKSLFLLQRCEIHAINSKFHDSMNVQIEINEHSTAKFEHCQIYNGKSYGVKVIKNSNLFLYHSQIFQHNLAQIIVNDSSVILKDSEIYQGKRNGLFIQNHSEAYIQESFISKHLQSQIWIDDESTLELSSVQLTDGAHSDLHAQNQSKVYVENSIIRNDKYRYNVQALNNSKIQIVKTVVENKYGDVYYSENNSSINNSDF